MTHRDLSSKVKNSGFNILRWQDKGGCQEVKCPGTKYLHRHGKNPLGRKSNYLLSYLVDTVGGELIKSITNQLTSMFLRTFALDLRSY